MAATWSCRRRPRAWARRSPNGGTTSSPSTSVNSSRAAAGHSAARSSCAAPRSIATASGAPAALPLAAPPRHVGGAAALFVLAVLIEEARGHDHDGADRVAEHRLAGRAEEEPGEAAAPPRADDDEVDGGGELGEQRRGVAVQRVLGHLDLAPRHRLVDGHAEALPHV